MSDWKANALASLDEARRDIEATTEPTIIVICAIGLVDLANERPLNVYANQSWRWLRQTFTKIPIDGLQPGATYYIAIQYQRNQNYSARQVYGPYTAPALIGDVMPNAPGLSQIKADIEAAFGDIFDVSGLLADARADIDAQGVEIAAARGGQPNLNSRILELNQAQIDGDEANAQAISLVQANTEALTADIIDLENALATETGAQAEAIQQVNARLAFNPNLQTNPTFANGFGGYSHDAPWITVHNRLGDYAQIDTMALPTGVARILDGVSPAAIVGPGEVVTISADAFLANTANDPNGGLRVQILWRNASNGAFLGGSLPIPQPTSACIERSAWGQRRSFRP